MNNYYNSIDWFLRKRYINSNIGFYNFKYCFLYDCIIIAVKSISICEIIILDRIFNIKYSFIV
jgi:hypothetical protein